MTKRTLPAAPAVSPCAGLSTALAPGVLARWNPAVQAAVTGDTTISILDPIGLDPWTGDGVTAKRVSAALRTIGARDAVVNVNSPGGDMFEGLAIYNLLREHPGRVTVKVLGVAASAASFIAMAGDEIQIGRASFLMVHNAWIRTSGNRHALREVAATLETFDRATAGVYAARTGLPVDEVTTLLDAETWLAGEDAIAKGFADAYLEADEAHEQADAAASARLAAKQLHLMLAEVPRAQVRRLLNEVRPDTRGTVDDAFLARVRAGLAEH